MKRISFANRGLSTLKCASRFKGAWLDLSRNTSLPKHQRHYDVRAFPLIASNVRSCRNSAVKYSMTLRAVVLADFHRNPRSVKHQHGGSQVVVFKPESKLKTKSKPNGLCLILRHQLYYCENALLNARFFKIVNFHGLNQSEVSLIAMFTGCTSGKKSFYLEDSFMFIYIVVL